MEKLAIMKNVDFGNRDVGTPCLFFQVNISECAGALQILSIEQSLNLIRESKIYSIKQLEGKACWVNVDQNRIEFLRYAGI